MPGRMADRLIQLDDLVDVVHGEIPSVAKRLYHN
jgi:hypothetical protein